MTRAPSADPTRAIEPSPDCVRCPRLAEFRAQCRAAHPDWHNAPVPSFGAASARLLVVGLAPGMKGANRTGRPFTGDFAGDLLYRTLTDYGFARGTYRARPDDGLTLTGARITNAVRCLPPANKPTGAEIRTCRQFLSAEIENIAPLRAIVALGRIAHDSVVAASGHRLVEFKFGHGARHQLRPGLRLFDSYHCSRYNTNTRRLTEAMFRSVFDEVRNYLGSQPASQAAASDLPVCAVEDAP